MFNLYWCTNKNFAKVSLSDFEAAKVVLLCQIGSDCYIFAVSLSPDKYFLIGKQDKDDYSIKRFGTVWQASFV